MVYEGDQTIQGRIDRTKKSYFKIDEQYKNVH